MLLTPTEQERLTIFTAAEVARRNLARDIKLSAPEAVAYICDELMVLARQGRTVADLAAHGRTLLNADQCLPGVADLMPLIQLEGMFPDGAKMVTVHGPIAPGTNGDADGGEPRPGEVITPDGEIELNAGRRRTSLRVTNTGDRPVQVGSHFHFFEANKALDFDRAAAFGMRLDMPSGTAVRFEPGESKDIDLVAVGGSGEVTGFNALTDGFVDSPEVREHALERARTLGFKGA